MVKKATWLITGGCGFLGTALIRKIQADLPEIQLRVLDNLSVGSKEDLKEVAPYFQEVSDFSQQDSSVALMVGDITDKATVGKATQGVDAIVHLAANTGVPISIEDPVKDFESNVIGTFNLLESCRNGGIPKFVLASSSAPIGDTEPPVHEEIAPHPKSPYGSSKLFGEAYCSSYFHSYGVKTIALRFGNVFGPGSYKKQSVVAKFVNQILNNEELEIYGNGKQTRDFIYVEDLLDAIIKSMESELGGEVFQIATNKERTVNELTEALVEEMKTRGYSSKVKHGEVRLGDVFRNYSDTSKAFKLLNWKAGFSFEEGIRLTVDDLISKHDNCI